MTSESGVRAKEEKANGDDLFVGHYAIFVIDILGQKERLAEWPTDMELSQQYIDVIKSTCGRVTAFQETFEKYFNSIESRDRSWLDKCAEHVRTHHQRYTDCDLRMQQFSDTFVFFAPMANSHGDLSLIPLLRMLGAAAMVMLVGLAGKCPIRGGIAIGPAMVLPNGSIYGPALAEAHCLESKVASYPRIAVSDGVLHLLENASGFSTDRGIEQSMQALAAECKNTIIRDTDGKPMVDFLGQIPIPRSDENAREWEHVMKAAFEFVRDSIKDFEEKGDEKLSKRYRQLQEYMESAINE